MDEFSPTGGFVGRLTGTPTGKAGAERPFKALQSVGVDTVSGDVFVAGYDYEHAKGILDVFGPDIVIPDVAVLEPPEALTPTSVTLRGTVNPLSAETHEGASCTFEYGTSTAYGQSAPCAAEVPEGNAPVEVKSKAGSITGLQSGTTYFYRLDATNAGKLTNTGECPADCGTFTTLGPGLSGESVSEVSSTSATLLASIDPHGVPTSFYFQYSTGSTGECESSPASCTSVPAPPGTPLAGEGPLAVSQHVQGLSPSTLYHFRVLAVQGAETFPGADQTFTTQPGGSGVVLPDGRQWELVSPADKHGARPLPIRESGLVQAAASGNGITYQGTAPTEADAKGLFEAERVLSTRGPQGWSSKDISLPHSSAVGGLSGDTEHHFFSEDLSKGEVEAFGDFSSLAPEVFPPDTETGPYIRYNATCAATPATCYRPLLVGCPPPNPELPCPPLVEENADVPAGTRFGGAAEFAGASSDLAHVVVSSPVLLTPPPHAGETTQSALYEFSAAAPPAQALQLVSVLPDGKLAHGNSTDRLPGLHRA